MVDMFFPLEESVLKVIVIHHLWLSLIKRWKCCKNVWTMWMFDQWEPPTHIPPFFLFEREATASSSFVPTQSVSLDRKLLPRRRRGCTCSPGARLSSGLVELVLWAGSEVLKSLITGGLNAKLNIDYCQCLSIYMCCFVPMCKWWGNICFVCVKMS